MISAPRLSASVVHTRYSQGSFHRNAILGINELTEPFEVEIMIYRGLFAVTVRKHDLCVMQNPGPGALPTGRQP